MKRRVTRAEEMAKKKAAKKAGMGKPSGGSRYAKKRGTHRPNAQWWFYRGAVDDRSTGAVHVTSEPEAASSAA